MGAKVVVFLHKSNFGARLNQKNLKTSNISVFIFNFGAQKQLHINQLNKTRQNEEVFIDARRCSADFQRDARSDQC
jgi:hypothetical protein